MREKQVCRRCESLSSNRRPFAVAGSTPHYAPDLPFKLEHILIEVTVDPKGKKIQGHVVQKLRVIAPNQKQIRMDQIGIEFEEVKVGNARVEFQTDGNSLLIPLAKAPEVGEELTVLIRYRVFNPKRGLYFTGPDSNYPKKRYQVWSQGQDEDNRHWIPSFDYPNQKAISEVIAIVPKGFTAVSNGALLSKADVSGGTRFHYKLGTPHVMYLVTLTVAEFSAWEDKGPHGLPVQYFVEPGREDDGKRAFSNTPKMIEAFEKKIGVPYAYEKYSQVAVQDFIFGGMENTSATTQTDLTLHDERAHLDFSSEPLVSHELAHQWFGDLLTCRDWSHGWLNEGFATFMERVWIENNSGEDGGMDEAKYYSYVDLKEYLDEDSGAYRRPIVCNTYIEPIDLFDRHLYNKGGLVLNLLRSVLGEGLFWKAIQLYVTRHRGGSVETLDLIRAIEDATGKNMRRFFDEWIFGAGYPELELSYQWNEEESIAEVVIEQKQTGGKPSVTDQGYTTHLFHLPAKIEFILKGGQQEVHTIPIGEVRDRVFFKLASKPLMVRFDSENTIPKTLKFPRPKEMLIYQLENDADCMGRVEAVIELAKISDHSILDALGKALKKDSFWGVQAQIADSLATIHGDKARDILLDGLSIKNPKARRTVVSALACFKDDRTIKALRGFADRDASYFVEAEATTAWAKAMLTPMADAKVQDEVEKFLQAQLKKTSYRDLIQSAAFRALAVLPGVLRGERPLALQALIQGSRAGGSMDARMAAIMTLGRVAQSAVPAERTRILKHLDLLSDEENFRVRMALVHALQDSQASEAIGILSKIRVLDSDGRVRRTAMGAIDSLTTAGSTPESVNTLKASLELLQEEVRKLKNSMDEMKGKDSASKKVDRKKAGKKAAKRKR